MVVQDIFGNKVNADKFEIYLMKECEVTESRSESPVIVFKGFENYRNKKFQKVCNETVLKILPANEENISQVIQIKDDFENKQREINIETENFVASVIFYRENPDLLGEILRQTYLSLEYTGTLSYLIGKEWQEERGYKLPRNDEKNRIDFISVNDKVCEHVQDEYTAPES